MPKFNDLERGYENLWGQAELDDNRVAEIEDTVDTILNNKEKYRSVERQTGVPWFWIACVHYRESSLNFNGVLHNGERIIGTGEKTSLVPAGRGPFDTWEDSALDVLRSRGLHLIDEWPVERCLFQWENYNGWGYFGRQNSPYVWAGTSLSDETGKFVRDGVYDPDAPEQQLGCAALLLKLVEMDEDVKVALFGEGEEEEKEEAKLEIRELVNEILRREGVENVVVTYGKTEKKETSTMNLLQLLDGKKTHLAALATAAAGILEGYLGVDIPGLEVQEPLTYILGAFGLSSIRDAIRKLIEALTGSSN